MGRPLKIAKAQAILTITDTNASGDYVTVSQNLSAPPTGLGIIAGMPFIPATSVGGLTGGTTYWVLQVLSANTFTVSATDLSANPTYTKVDLSGTTGQSVAATVGVVDAYFNNPVTPPGYPATNTTTYSVVGGNTAIFGKQVLANVAIGQNGEGTLYASDSSNVVGGLNTDLGNIGVNSIIQYINASGEAVTLGYVDTATGLANVEISNATATGNFLTTVGAATDLYEDLPVILTANIGGLTAGTVYYVQTVANATAFSVSLTPGGSNVGLSDEDAESYALQDTLLLVNDASANLSGASYIYATPEAGYIVRQKGKQKYLVTGTTTGLTGACYTANVANTALTPNTMTITGTYANAATVKVQSLSDHTAELFTATSGPVATGNIVLANADPAFSTFNAAAAANVANAQPYPLVTIGNA